jgi:hypothetical protein
MQKNPTSEKKRRLLETSAYLTISVYIDLVNQALNFLDIFHFPEGKNVYI